ncbi:hypothetical protein ACH429_14765 [Streptomyces pathocidini]|uniref:DUF8094 domain-containing protein n=1 Tax=Streptomyces pathocidini TaxID=1650571 RepID=A0ABW7URU9_9ACTN|nr:hypothetical protein [Streptomyces pathocidini]
MTVHGEREILPSATKADAAKALQRFTTGYNKAYTKSDPAAMSAVETGPLHALTLPGVRAQRETRPKGWPDYPALRLKDAEFTIPKQKGWPRFFLADAASNRDDNRWLVLFTRNGSTEPWKAAYLAVVAENQVPEFRTDQDGWAEPVGGGAGLPIAPNRLSRAYAEYLRTGEGEFADGALTSVLRAQRQRTAKTLRYWTEYIDQPAGPPQYAPVALRTADGGALAFFAAHHAEKRTMAPGYKVGEIDNSTANTLMKGKPEKWLSLAKISESVVRIPKNGPVEFLNRLEGLTAAKGG